MESGLSGPRVSVRQALFALSGNRCAFPDCNALMFQNGVIIGEICHIEARRPGEARHNASLDAEELHGIENLILLCRNHHKLIDDRPDLYTVEWLRRTKHENELSAPDTSTDIIVGVALLPRLEKLEPLMPELITEMRSDIQADVSHLIREFVILPSPQVLFNSAKARFFYYEETHPALANQLDLLEEYGLIRDISHNSTPIYRFEEPFLELLAAQNAQGETQDGGRSV